MQKIIFILWLQGFDNAPFLVKKCLASWIEKNPGWNVICLNKDSLKYYINDDIKAFNLADKAITYAAISDFIRICLLKKYGGLWVDATTYCTIPLDDWLENYIKSGFFSFSYKTTPNGQPDRLISSWFLYGEKNNLIIDAWYQAVLIYFKTIKNIGAHTAVVSLERWNQGDREGHYFWFHYLFGDLCKVYLKFSNEWAQVPKISEAGPHFLQRSGMLNSMTKEVKNHIDTKKSPLYKLTYRYKHDDYNRQCSLHYLLEANLSFINIGNTIYQVRDVFPNLRFIHIGKCGGTSLLTAFKDQGIKLQNFHLTKPEFNPNHQYIIWIRNPLRRFVSAYNFSAALINFDTSGLDINKLTIDNCLAPSRIRHKMIHGHCFESEYEELVLYFQTANNLAESLSHFDQSIRAKAFRLMSYPLEHISKGIGWYLTNGEFIKNHNKNILFVGKVETINADMKRLSIILNIPAEVKINKVRENDKLLSSYLSPLAVNNLLSFYRETDYKAIRELYACGWIDEKTFQSYWEP